MNQRMEKLARLRKIAEDGPSPYGKFDAMFKDTKLDQLYKIFSDEFISSAYIDDQKVRALGYYIGLFGGTESNLYRFCIADHPNIFGNLKSIEELVNTNDAGYSDFKPNFDAGVAKREEIANGPVSNKIDERYRKISRYIQDNKTTDSNTLKKYVDTYFSGEKILEDMSSSIEKDIFIKEFSNSPFLKNTKDDLYKEIDKKSAPTSPSSGSSKKTNNKPSDSSRPQAATGEILIDEAHRGLTGLVDGNDPRFVYTTAPDGSWATYTYKGSPGKIILNKDYKNWPEVVRQMNAFPIGNATKTPAAGATTAPAAATAPATETPKADKPAERPDLNPMAVANVQAIIYRASTKALAFWTRQDEMGRIKDMIMAIKEQLPEIRGSDNSALDYLAKIVYSRNKTVLDPFVGAEDISAAIYRAEPKDLKVAKKGQYSQAVSEVLKAVNRIYDEQRRTPNYFKSLKKETKAETDKADDGSSFGKKSSLDPRIKKLAKLRRLRVRAQMEAAIEPSAKFGRSRVS